MAESVQGLKRFLLYRLLEDADSNEGVKIALQEEHEVKSSRDTDTTATKDGTTVTLGAIEQEVTATSYLSAGDDTIDKLKEAFEDGKIVELWDVDITPANKKGDDYKATYYRAYLTEVDETAEADSDFEVELTFTVQGKGVRGYTPLSGNQEAAAQYAFTTTARALG